MKVLITGASGSLGQRLSQVFSKERPDLTLTLTGRRSANELMLPAGSTYMQGSLGDKSFCETLCNEQEVVIHCAARTSLVGSYDAFYEDNVLATQNLFEAARTSKVRRFIHISTPSIYYAEESRFDIAESSVLPEPATLYARTKFEAEEVIRKYSSDSGIETIILRPRAIFGPTDQVLLPRILRVMNKGFFPVFDKGHARIDLSFVDNVVSAIELCLEHRIKKNGEAYNITNGEPWRVIDLLEYLRGHLKETRDKPIRFVHLSSGFAKRVAGILEFFYSFLRIEKEPPLTRYGIGLLSHDCTLDITKAQVELGYKAIVPMKEALALTLSTQEHRNDVQ